MISHGITEDLSGLKKINKQYQDELNRSHEKNIEILSNDLNLYYQKHVVESCKLKLSNLPDENINEKKESLCRNLFIIKQEAFHIFKLEGTQQYAAEAKKFVRKNEEILNPIESSIDFDNEKKDTTLSDELVKIAIENSIKRQRKQLIDQCINRIEDILNITKKITQEFLIETNTARTTVESLVDSFFSEKK